MKLNVKMAQLTPLSPTEACLVLLYIQYIGRTIICHKSIYSHISKPRDTVGIIRVFAIGFLEQDTNCFSSSSVCQMPCWKETSIPLTSYGLTSMSGTINHLDLICGICIWNLSLLTLNMKPEELSLPVKQAIIRLNNQNKPIREIAKPLGVAKSILFI